MVLHASPRPEAGAPAAGRHVRRGALAALPLVIGLAPFGLAVGAAAGASADPLAAWAGTLLIYSGSAHLGLLQLLQEGTPVWTAVLAAVLVNARLVVYSATLAPLWAGVRLPWRLLAAATVVEPTFAVAERWRTSGAGPDGALAHYGGGAATVTAGWLAVVSLGTVVGRTPASADVLAVAVPLCLVVLVVPHLRVPGGPLAVLAAAGTALAARAALPGAEILLAMAAAAIVGAVAARRSA